MLKSKIVIERFLPLHRHIKFLNNKFRSLTNNISKLNVCLNQVRFNSQGSCLTSAYGCDDVWNHRLKNSITQEIKSIEYYYDLLRKHKKDGIISAIDADIFINSIKTDSATDLSNEIEEILRLLRRSPETINTLQSTQHNAIRLLLASNRDENILKLISDPMNYGVFLDHFLANLLMSSFLDKENFMAAARVASSLMLQEDYGPPLTQSLALLSCFRYGLNMKSNQEWVHYNQIEEPEEEVKIIVAYIRNPYFDDHFDLRNPQHIVGKTLAWLAPFVQDSVLKANAEVLCWSLYEKWSDLDSVLKNISTTNVHLDKELVSVLHSQIEKCGDNNLKINLQSFLSGLENRADFVKDFDIMNEIKVLVKNEASKTEIEDITKQGAIYDEFAVIHKETLERQIELYERRRILTEIKEKKKNLQEREEVIFFFENQDKIDVELERKREMYPEEEIVAKNTKDEDEYIPPEILKIRKK